jgi:hypothetical protein
MSMLLPAAREFCVLGPFLLAWFVACNKPAPSPSNSDPPPQASASTPSATPEPPTAAAKPATKTPGADPCVTVCERSKALKCRAVAECARRCAESRNLAACNSEMSAVLQCIIREPAGHWECSEDGLASIKDGYCDAEQAAFMACVVQAAR